MQHLYLKLNKKKYNLRIEIKKVLSIRRFDELLHHFSAFLSISAAASAGVISPINASTICSLIIGEI